MSASSVKGGGPVPGKTGIGQYNISQNVSQVSSLNLS